MTVHIFFSIRLLLLLLLLVLLVLFRILGLTFVSVCVCVRVNLLCVFFGFCAMARTFKMRYILALRLLYLSTSILRFVRLFAIVSIVCAAL